jgi:CHAT domain-containing protein
MSFAGFAFRSANQSRVVEARRPRLVPFPHIRPFFPRGWLHSTRGTVGPLPKGKGAKVPAGERPYEHPYYWASFVLIGAPD